MVINSEHNLKQPPELKHEQYSSDFHEDVCDYVADIYTSLYSVVVLTK